MILTRQKIEEREQQVLAPYAVKSAESRGREHSEKEDPYRTCFQRDRDRVIHSKAFRRLKGKTQVFISHYGDHYRSRLTHSMEVAQLSRDIARMLSLNEDLAESIGLAHDLGHTPFGHAGQDEMHLLMKRYGGRFEHNEQSRRIVDHLEEKSIHHPGLNLSFEVRDGLLKHRTTYDQPEVTDTFMPSLEAQVVNMADEIAYQNHDIDDGLRAKIFHPKDLDQLAIWKIARQDVDQDLPFHVWVLAMVSRLIKVMVNDLAENTSRLIKEHDIQSVDDIYDTKQSFCEFSDEMKVMTTELKDFLYQNFYQSDGVAGYNEKGKEVIRTLFEAFMTDTNLLPHHIRERIGDAQVNVVVKDYIAGMTDNFALSLYENFS